MSQPEFDELYVVGANDVAQRRAGVIAARVEAAALATVPARYGTYTRANWRGKWPFPNSLSAWPKAASNGSPATWSVLLLGSVGTGKSHAATALFREAVARSPHGGAWLDVAQTLDAVKVGFDRPGRAPAEVSCFAPGVLLLDDLGAERATDFARDFVSRVLRFRHAEMLPTIATSNASNLADLSNALDGRVISRLYEGEILLLAGPDRRQSA